MQLECYKKQTQTGNDHGDFSRDYGERASANNDYMAKIEEHLFEPL